MTPPTPTSYVEACRIVAEVLDAPRSKNVAADVVDELLRHPRVLAILLVIALDESRAS